MNTLFSLRPVLAVDRGEHDYVNVSASPSQVGGGGGGGMWKIVRTSGKILATPLYCTVFITCEHFYTK